MIRRNSAFIVAISTDGYIPFGVRSDNGQLELPGGGFEMTEQSPAEAGVREAFEEIRLNVDPAKLKLVGFLNQRICVPPNDYDHGFVFLYEVQLPYTKLELEQLLHPSGLPNEPVGVVLLNLHQILNSGSAMLLGHTRMVMHAFREKVNATGYLGWLKDPVTLGDIRI